MWRHVRILYTHSKAYANRCNPLCVALTKRTAFDIGVVALTGGIITTRVLTCKNDDESWLKFATIAVRNAVSVCQEGVENKPKAIVGIIGVNCVVFGLWRISLNRKGMHRWMWRHFACSFDAVFTGKRYHTLFTSAFSQITFPYFAINMFMLWEFGAQIVEKNDATFWIQNAFSESKMAALMRKRFGWKKKLSENEFLAMYAGAAIISSISSIVVSRFRGMWQVYTLGASGCVMAVFTLYCSMYPNERLLLYGLFDCSALDMLKLTTAGNIVGVAYQRKVPIDFVGHLAGQATGYAFDKRMRQLGY